jgi:hypothetical protein
LLLNRSQTELPTSNGWAQPQPDTCRRSGSRHTSPQTSPPAITVTGTGLAVRGGKQKQTNRPAQSSDRSRGSTASPILPRGAPTPTRTSHPLTSPRPAGRARRRGGHAVARSARAGTCCRFRFARSARFQGWGASIPGFGFRLLAESGPVASV